VAESEAVNQLHVDLGKYRKALSDRPRLIGQRHEQRSLAKQLLAEWRPELEIEESAALRVFVGRRARIQKLVAERERLDERLASAVRDGAKAAEKKEALKRQGSQLPPTRDVERLVVAVNEARRGGDAEDERDKAVQVVKRLTTQRDAGLEKLGLAAASADRLEKVRAPSAAVIARFEARDKEVQDAARVTKSERQRIDKESRALNAKIEKLHSKEAVPTVEDLAAARSRRDAAFELLREHWDKGRDVTEKAMSPRWCSCASRTCNTPASRAWAAVK
jgi:type I site-specific restriction endonuclease